MREINSENQPVVEENIPAVEENIAEEPKVEEVKAEETVIEEPKVEEVVAEEPKVDEVITTPHLVSNSEPTEISMGNDSSTGAFSTTVKKAVKKTAPKADKPAKQEVDKTQVVVFSEKNIYFPGTGKLTYGFNIVTEKQAEVYLKHKSVRPATPDELARKYSK
ncbi:hypothetical protein EB001_26045 [bacterium]|nr:hypothetical protein [bacterium]